MIRTPYHYLDQKVKVYKNNVGRVGIEPTTLSLKAPALPIELPTQFLIIQQLVK